MSVTLTPSTLMISNHSMEIDMNKYKGTGASLLTEATSTSKRCALPNSDHTKISTHFFKAHCRVIPQK